ncbi:LOW QUALITY PROTEIN: DNA mismatch repair protein MLH1 [Selaginella moellendorffii]|uniref:LOW QUALITY PROTEIN: DNA mismatch repair protein MLH1 n=1 Tax=Selaginella moellendorffii TaxID=88036 RepID=UPI000D1CD81A|nr:LOW QUALITY PROTEIN: DNA mismatch repair protein MLH1 [Selaginella moellendorffii]|eukprot:XP_024542568.1 LOW QUALITY PROTEIN: DNA mismatch repair protein MLH1 [Selaginella moellendorffii]
MDMALPPRIRKLEESVVNRIAAGEVIQRPASALKELLENSLDAGATVVSVIVKDGGLKLIQITDNGHGIRYEDLPILCERHTTSKITAFEDLQRVSTLGFRGEALASMTFVAHLTVTTMTEGQTHGYRASYKDGAMEGDPRPCAAVKGTQIMVENLFYNVTARRKSFKNPSDEYARVVDVISKYSIQNPKVGFSCKKFGDARADVQTPGNTSALEAIRAVYGPGTSRELIEIKTSKNDSSDSFEMNGYISSANYSAKRTTMILFINDRLVDCAPLKRAIEVVYAAVLPKASKPYIYMSIRLPSEHVDVNVHPTKKEVSFLNQESLIEAIQTAVEQELLQSNKSRTFYAQTSLEAAFLPQGQPRSQAENKSSQKAPVNKLVRTDSQSPAGRMHAFLASGAELKNDLTAMRRIVRQRRHSNDTSGSSSGSSAVERMLAAVDTETHSGLLEIIRHSTFIGMADDVLALIQHKTRLYLMNCLTLSKELMYQQALVRLRRLNALRLSNPAPVYDLIVMALDEEEQCGNYHATDGSKDGIAQVYCNQILKRAEFLRECFSIDIDDNGNVCTLPLIVEQHTPDMDRLPLFALHLSKSVDCDVEDECFEAVARALSEFYALHPPLLPRPSTNPPGKSYENCYPLSQLCAESNETEMDEDVGLEAESKWSQRDWTIQHVLFPAMKLLLKPPVRMATDGTALQVACLENLYKIFERC